MAKLWTFGDSLTAGSGCVPNIPLRDKDFTYYNEYRKEGDDIWVNHLAKKLNLEPNNIGKSGASNDYIIDSIIDNFNKFESNDVVIIQKTYYHRFDVPNIKDNKFHTHYAESLNLLDKDLRNNKNIRDKTEMETILNYGVLFASHELNKDRQDKRFNFLFNTIKPLVSTVYMWDISPVYEVQTITQHTKGHIKDNHYSFEGHRYMADKLYRLIFGEKNIF